MDREGLPRDPFGHKGTNVGAAVLFAFINPGVLPPHAINSLFGSLGVAPMHVGNPPAAEDYVNRLKAAARRHAHNVDTATTTDERSAAQTAQATFLKYFGQ